jgi:hypothetical protein
MQLDSTRIAVRERSLPEVFDLALHVTREFAGPWLFCSLLAIVPLALLNYALIGWMTDLDYDTDLPGLRFAWNMTLLIFIEAPLASVFVTAFLGPAVFMEQRTIRQVIGDVFRFRRTRPDDTRPALNLFLCQLILRGILPVWLIYLTVDRYQFSPFQEGFLIPAIACYSMAIRAFRPYLNEIILLEKNPLRSKDPQRITIGKRSSHLHGPSSGDLFVRWIVSAMIGLLLIGLVLATAELLLGVLVGIMPFEIDSVTEEVTAWNIDWLQLQIVWPACLWLVAAYFSVVRFLSYLDLRIRHEGWEVELLMRAEALRMAAKVG